MILGLNIPGVLAVNEELAHFRDIENSGSNVIEISTLDFSLSSLANFLPLVSLTQPAKRAISVINNGSLGFQYTVYADEFSGDTDFCNALRLDANLDNGESEYIGNLTDFIFEAGKFFETENWEFIASLPDDNPEFENKICNFKFIFDGVQLGDCAGFSDYEEIENTIISTQFEPYLVINKVYYNVDSEHGTEQKNEWIELYNPTDEDINIEKWEICNNSQCKVIDKQVNVPTLGYALLSHDNTTWTEYWDVPDFVETINLGTAPANGWLDNVADMLILKDSHGNIIDQMNWGYSNNGWQNWNSNVWNPGVLGAAKGNVLGRVPTGFDTDKVSDWEYLGLPEVTVLYPNGGEQWFIVPPHLAHLWFGIYPISWEAFNYNGSDENLKIDIWFCNKHGNNCFYKIVDDTYNDGEYEWTIPYDHRFVGADIKIKISAEGPENFMVQTWDKSDNDFCPPLLTESEVLEMLLFETIESSEEILVEEILVEEILVEEIPDEEILVEGMNDEETSPEETFEEIVNDNEVPDTLIINNNTFVGISAPGVEDAVVEFDGNGGAGDDIGDESIAEAPVNETSDEAPEQSEVEPPTNDDDEVDSGDEEVLDTLIINNNTFVATGSVDTESAVDEIGDGNNDNAEEVPIDAEAPVEGLSIDEPEPEFSEVGLPKIESELEQSEVEPPTIEPTQSLSGIQAGEPEPLPTQVPSETEEGAEPVIEPEPVITPEPVEVPAPAPVEPPPDE